jgi:branched-subunit amino acid aminotransferase/4-amino-4-deoxychorismate lyase
MPGVGYQVEEEMIPRETIYIADGFLRDCAEITPIRTVDKLKIKMASAGKLQRKFRMNF